jgi:hypothetical protein
MKQNLEICWCLELLGLDQDATMEDANQSYAYLFQMINLLYSTNQDADQMNRRHDKLHRLEYAYQKVIDHIHGQDPIASDNRLANGFKEDPFVVKSINKAVAALQGARKEKAKADARYSAAMVELQKSIRIKREADVFWMEALEIWNRSRFHQSETDDTNSANVRGISQTWLQSERRKQSRIKFLFGKHPILTIFGKKCPVMDISRDGIRFQTDYKLGNDRIIRGRLDGQGILSMDIVGKVIRNLDDEVAARLITRIADTLISSFSC